MTSNFWLKQLIAFPVWAQLCCICQGDEPKTNFQVIREGLKKKKLTEFSVKVGGWGQHWTDFPLFLSSANEVSTGPTCHFLFVCVSVFPVFFFKRLIG